MLRTRLDAADPTDAATADPQDGLSAHDVSLAANGEAEPEQPAEGGVDEAEGVEPESTAEVPTADIETASSEPVDAETAPVVGEGSYIGAEPPEGYIIKGNDRSMKYHLPESSGYHRTIAEVWFNSEEAAQAAGYIRAQR